MAGEFQFWELGLFKKNIKNRFLYQHSGVRYNDSRIEFFKERNNKVNIITHHLSELKYLKKLGFNCVNFAYRLRNNDEIKIK